MASEIRVNKIANRAGLSTVEYTDTGIIVSGIVTCTEISGLNALNIAGVSTFASPLDINGDIDVDGHTNLDNLSVVGISTFTGAIESTGSLTITSNVPTIHLTELDANPDYQIRCSGGDFKIRADGSGKIVINADGHIDLVDHVDISSGLDVTGNATVSRDLDVDGHTNLDNVSIAGVTTLTEAIYPNQGSYGTATAGKIKQYANRLYVQGGTDGIMFANHANNRWQINSSGYFMPVTDSTFDIGDNTTRVRNIYADTYYGDGANLTNLPAGAPVGGASTNTVFFENDKAVAVNYQVTSTKNAMSAGPIAINAGIAVTVPSGCSWTIV